VRSMRAFNAAYADARSGLCPGIPRGVQHTSTRAALFAHRVLEEGFACPGAAIRAHAQEYAAKRVSLGFGRYRVGPSAVCVFLCFSLRITTHSRRIAKRIRRRPRCRYRPPAHSSLRVSRRRRPRSCVVSKRGGFAGSVLRPRAPAYAFAHRDAVICALNVAIIHARGTNCVQPALSTLPTITTTTTAWRRRRSRNAG